MSLYIFFYILLILFFLYFGVYVFQKYKKYSGIFFLISVMFLGIWSLLYISIFGLIIKKELLLYIFRVMYTLSFLSMYSMLLFVHFFGKQIERKILYQNGLLFLFIFLIFIFTPLLVVDLKIIEDKGYYFENYGLLYNLILFLYALFTPVFLLISFIRIKSLNYINKNRLKIITIGFSIFMFFSILFYVILPYLGKFYFEDNAVIFSIPFILAVLYSTNSYNFSNLKIKLGKIVVISFSMFYSIILVELFKYYYSELPKYFSHFWGFSTQLGTIDLALSIIIFIIIYNLLNKIFLGNTNLLYFEKEINKFKKYIPYISNIENLNIFFKKHFYLLFKIKYVNIKIFHKKDSNLELYKYFIKDKSRELFMNDIVFIEENKYKFDLLTLKKEININIYLIFPLFNNKNDLIGIFEIGDKPFKDTYTKEEIDILKDFSEFLIGHLKYIKIYSNINNLNINLDKIVDEKTIKYNQLLNKQTEFISMASHEIKSPIGSSIFQLDYILDEIDDGNISVEGIKKELIILNNTLIKVGELTNKIFSVEKYDLNKVILYKQELDFTKYLNEIVSIFSSINKNVNFINIIEDKNIFLKIDKIQFKQVIDNLLNNALKFSNKIKPKILLEFKIKGNNVFIKIEDNGKGFKHSENKIIFEKYNSLNNVSTGIGLGLYLCKSIVELHGGKIIAEKSSRLGGAKFLITLPISN